MNAPTTRLPPPTVDELEGRALYGDNFTPEQIAIWFAEEEDGYYRLTNGQAQADAGDPFHYLVSDTYHYYRHIDDRRFEVCLALGCADGSDVAHLGPRVGRFIGIEPAETWWSGELGGRPAEFRKPRPDGLIDLPDASIDLVTAFSVLHHIPNVSVVFAELARVLRPGGVMLLREPVVSMGDFRQPRVGLTAHERGIPLALLERLFRANGLTVQRGTVARINGFFRVLQALGLPGNSRWAVVIDAWASRLLRFNLHYWRRNVWQKISPHAGLFILLKA